MSAPGHIHHYHPNDDGIFERLKYIRADIVDQMAEALEVLLRDEQPVHKAEAMGQAALAAYREAKG